MQFCDISWHLGNYPKYPQSGICEIRRQLILQWIYSMLWERHWKNLLSILWENPFEMIPSKTRRKPSSVTSAKTRGIRGNGSLDVASFQIRRRYCSISRSSISPSLILPWLVPHLHFPPQRSQTVCKHTANSLPLIVTGYTLKDPRGHANNIQSRTIKLEHKDRMIAQPPLNILHPVTITMVPLLIRTTKQHIPTQPVLKLKSLELYQPSHNAKQQIPVL